MLYTVNLHEGGHPSPEELSFDAHDVSIVHTWAPVNGYRLVSFLIPSTHSDVRDRIEAPPHEIRVTARTSRAQIVLYPKKIRFMIHHALPEQLLTFTTERQDVINPRAIVEDILFEPTEDVWFEAPNKPHVRVFVVIKSSS
jgi:hypothetical protein